LRSPQLYKAADLIYTTGRKPTIIEAYVDPFEPPMPPKVEMSFVNNLAESFARGQPYAGRIGLTLFRDQVHNILKNIHSHSSEKEAN
jgi:pyruvate dehydrogenase (quinone)